MVIIKLCTKYIFSENAKTYVRDDFRHCRHMSNKEKYIYFQMDDVIEAIIPFVAGILHQMRWIKLCLKKLNINRAIIYDIEQK